MIQFVLNFLLINPLLALSIMLVRDLKLELSELLRMAEQVVVPPIPVPGASDRTAVVDTAPLAPQVLKQTSQILLPSLESRVRGSPDKLSPVLAEAESEGVAVVAVLFNWCSELRPWRRSDRALVCAVSSDDLLVDIVESVIFCWGSRLSQFFEDFEVAVSALEVVPRVPSSPPSGPPAPSASPSTLLVASEDADEASELSALSSCEFSLLFDSSELSESPSLPSGEPLWFSSADSSTASPTSIPSPAVNDSAEASVLCSLALGEPSSASESSELSVSSDLMAGWSAGSAASSASPAPS